MLPYHLRDSRKIDKKGATKRQRDEVLSEANPNTECGGPVQRAIMCDLVNLRKTFREQLVCRMTGRDDFSSHWKAGTAFSIFKAVFGSSKIAMLHLLPPARCDREAYSQLVYASCLELFKGSFVQTGKTIAENSPGGGKDGISGCNHFDDACFAIFSLYALFETNPLPRQFETDNPLQLLSVSLRSSDDPDTSHRRCFSKNIRIDREHFALLLELKELSLAKKCECERSFYERQRSLLQGSKHTEQRKQSSPNAEKGHSLHCSCSVSTDILEILDRLFNRLELSEYTGPLGAEAFAGHPEYPHNRSTGSQESRTRSGGLIPPQYQLHEAEEVRDYFGEPRTDDIGEITASIGKYKQSVAAIRMPSPKSNAVKQLQAKLETLFFYKKPLDSSRLELNGLLPEAVGDHNETQEQLEPLARSDISQRYQIILHGEIDNYLKKQLHASISTLLRRDEPIPPPSHFTNRSTKSSLDRDDISSIGLGGISIRTGQGGAGIQKEISSLGMSKKSRSKNETEVITNPNLASMFLTANENVDSSWSSDDNTVDSEISMQSFTDEDGVEEDGISVATSTFGKRALDDLLQKVTQEGGGVHGKRRKNQKVESTKKRKKKEITGTSLSFIAKGSKEDDATSVATSTYGKKALDDLLMKVAQEGVEVNTDRANSTRIRNRIVGATNAKEGKKQGEATVLPRLTAGWKKDGDETSVATSAFGKRALEELLQTAAQEGDRVKTERRKKQKARSKTQKKGKKQGNAARLAYSPSSRKDSDDEASVATSTYGKRALDDLLQRVTQEGDKASIRRKNQKAASAKKKKGKKQQHASTQPSFNTMGNTDIDETSVATSTYGKRALEELLQTVTKEDLTTHEEDGKDFNETTKQRRRVQKHSPIDACSSTSRGKVVDEMSVATSAFGERALEELLQNVPQEDELVRVDDSDRQNRKEQNGEKQRMINQPRNSNAKDKEEEDEISVATSAFGKRALDDLLREF